MHRLRTNNNMTDTSRFLINFTMLSTFLKIFYYPVTGVFSRGGDGRGGGNFILSNVRHAPPFTLYKKTKWS